MVKLKDLKINIFDIALRWLQVLNERDLFAMVNMVTMEQQGEVKIELLVAEEADK